MRAGVAAFLLAAVFMLILAIALPSLLDPAARLEGVAQRCLDSEPTWENYQEDVKAQIGATPVALWAGEPVAGRMEAGEFRLTMRVEPPWDDLHCAMPIMLRDPMGRVHLAREAQGSGSERVYSFALSGGASSAPPWVEVHYPHRIARLPLENGGIWQPPQE